MSPYRESKPASIPDGTVRYFKVDRRELVYLKFILEAYEGMSTLSTVDQTGVIIRLSIPSGFEDDVQSILDTVGEDIPISEVPFGTEDAASA
jgi:hypothetical protein